ncbi:CocE/NonD family hydrolase [Streptomyces sp. MBT56]|uniref:CocE/NonD family hydrolase n=1 Tax=unclassified Streptomyces TaxID=2593676 RepID=UPI00190DE4E6|nr:MULTISPECIES: CocE/NonD family hydrolase [unclassified Streptomyces]MBK3559415.1 CocE/NonD family hydrolase [Streptomyces sp. MBT56]MBK3605550.1 CocE/NonD family hydrolase [Streptomyces sp. MBT54]MBK3618157.1 CocE/NonD family hydrolase [Streptomyces sp. MBT98]MBK6042247.1 CocE/NonD family hydrolase [Streptomyces sp. MBT55]
MNITTEFPYETTHEDVRIPLSDGTRLYARIWRPLTDEPVPALLEYLPYRLSDWTAPRDWQRHPWYAGHGYASVRVDVRGHGNSEGLPGDEYDAQELADGVAVIHWLAQQEWCSGRVGMFGISWGGFNSLQIAALAPEPLKAIVTVCSADDRYDNDVHYMGGSVLAVDMHAWAATMLAFVCRPPDPAQVGDDWKEMWLKRLEAVEPFSHTWLAHQSRDAYWKHGSVCEDYGAIKASVLAVGGWHDPYRDTVLRLVEHLDPGQVRGIIGPWSHQYPDRGLPPGPAIGFLQETLRWWDQHLKGKETGVMREPLLRSWISGSHPPATVYETLPGRWVGDASWPSENVNPMAYALQGGERIVASPQQTGLDAGRFFPFGNEADLPPDQRDEDAKSVSFEFPVTDAPIEILGRPRVKLRIRMDATRGQAIARLCDVAPDGASTLVTRGVLNLAARNGRDRADDWTPGESEDVVFDLNGIGHTFPPGHRIRIAISSAYWPWIWPQAGSAGFTLDADGSFVELPVRRHTEDPAITFGEPEQSEPLGVVYPVTLEEPRPERLVVRDVAQGEWRLEVDPRYGGTRVYPDGLEFTEDALETYTIQQDDPLSARTRSDWTIRLHRPEAAWDVGIETRSEITADEHDFITSDEVICKDGEEIVFHRTWEKRIPRTAG